MSEMTENNNNNLSKLNNNNEKVLPTAKTPPRYQESSIRFRDAWLEYVEKEELVKFEIVNMIKILEAVGYTRMGAVKKIVNDHNDLRGFSQATIYRELPEDMKRKYKSDYDNMLPDDSDLSNDKLVEPNKISNNGHDNDDNVTNKQ